MRSLASTRTLRLLRREGVEDDTVNADETLTEKQAALTEKQAALTELAVASTLGRLWFSFWALLSTQ